MGVLMNYKISDVEVKQPNLKYAVTLKRKLWIEVLPDNFIGIQFSFQFKHTDNAIQHNVF